MALTDQEIVDERVRRRAERRRRQAETEDARAGALGKRGRRRKLPSVTPTEREQQAARAWQGQSGV